MTKKLSNKGRKILTTVGIALVIFALLFIAYVWVLQPILGNPFVPYGDYHDPALFQPENYEKFEKGAVFAEQFFSYSFSKDCEVIDFYYSDNRTYDSFLYGKRPDVYAITLDAGESYEEIVAYIQSNGVFISTDGVGEGDTAFYLMPSSGVISDRFVFRFGVREQALQFILITEIEEEFFDQIGGEWNLLPTILRWSGIKLDVNMP